MSSSFPLRTVIVGLALSASALAQTPPPPPDGAALTSAPAIAGQRTPGAPGTASLVTQRSRIRAFNPGPDGQVRSLYLTNGTVVDLSPDLGRQLGATIRKGARISVNGARSNVYGQALLSATSLTIGSQTFVAQPAAMGGTVPPPAPGQGGPSRRGPRPEVAGLRRPGPDGQGPGGPPPPPPAGPEGPRGARRGGIQPPPLPPPNGQTPAGPPAVGDAQRPPTAPPPSTGRPEGPPAAPPVAPPAAGAPQPLPNGPSL